MKPVGEPAVATRSERSRHPDRAFIGEQVIPTRTPIFALTTAFTCIVASVLLYCQGSWMWSAAFLALSTLLVAWQAHTVYTSPVLVVRDPIVTLYRSGVAAGSFALSDACSF